MFVCLNSASNRSLWHPAVPFHWPGGRTVTSDCRSELSRALRRDRAVTQQTTLLRKYCQVDSTHRKRQNIFYHNNLPYICLSVRLPVCLSKVQIIMLPHVACVWQCQELFILKPSMTPSGETRFLKRRIFRVNSLQQNHQNSPENN